MAATLPPVVITFQRPARLLNLNDRMHWRAKANYTATWRQAAKVAALQHYAPHLGRTLVKVTLPVRTPNTRRDPSNWYPTIKAIVDGITDAGVWPDDHAGYVVTQEPTFTAGNVVTVELEPA